MGSQTLERDAAEDCTAETMTEGLYLKLAEVHGEVQNVQKDGKNSFHKYSYVSAEAMLKAIRGPLTARNVVLMPAVDRIVERTIKTAKGGESTITTVFMSFTFIDGMTGERWSTVWSGQGDDPGDKGIGKAITNAIKTFLRTQFLIPTGDDDPEADNGADERAAGRVSQPAAGASPDLFGRAKGKALFMASALASKGDFTIEDLRSTVDGTTSIAELKGVYEHMSDELRKAGGDPELVGQRFEEAH